MHEIFANQGYSSTQCSPSEQNARLATHIAVFLRATQQNDGQWAGSHPGHQLRNTCHALEALQLLNLPAFRRNLERGVDWLINLGEDIDAESDDWLPVSLHPSRFKTLVRLNAFGDDQVQREFAELCRRMHRPGRRQNGIHDSPLSGIIVADCLLELSVGSYAPPDSGELLDQLLDSLEGDLDAWQHWSEERQIEEIGDMSYALDVLRRAGRMHLSDLPAQAVLTVMLKTLARQEQPGPLLKGSIYSAIQLGTHFAQAGEARQVLDRFFHTLRIRYDQNQVQRPNRHDDLQPLILRALLTCGGAELREHMLGQLLDLVYDQVSQRQQVRTAERNRRFEELIRRRATVHIHDVAELTGGITDARVFRVNYSVDGDGLGMQTNGSRTSADAYSIVVKAGARADLLRSLAEYRTLRPDIQHHFARHSSEPEMLETTLQAPAYMILEDLTSDYSTLREIVNRVDRHRLPPDGREALDRATTAVAQALFDIYRKTRRKESDLVGYQVARLYFMRLDRALITMCRPEKFPKLKDYFRGFWHQGHRYDSIERYQTLLYRYSEALRPPSLMLMHGDCHGRNVMLDNGYVHMKLIDLDKLDPAGDYILDMGLLIEDMALFRRIFDESYRGYLKPENVQIAPDKAEIGYVHSLSEAAVIFQEVLLRQLEPFATELGDKGFRPRLWLSIALYLLRLVDKANDLQHGAVLYAEAIKLLDALATHLETGEPLPPIPFPREADHSAAQARTFPWTAEAQDLRTVLEEQAAALGLEVREAVRPNGRSVAFFVGRVDEPFIILDAKRQPPGFLLRCPLEALGDHHGYAQPIATSGPVRPGAPQTVIRPPAGYDRVTVANLVKRALANWLEEADGVMADGVEAGSVIVGDVKADDVKADGVDIGVEL